MRLDIKSGYLLMSAGHVETWVQGKAALPFLGKVGGVGDS